MDLAILLRNDNVQTVNQLASLLHIFNHRNKNQHRRSLWWRHFSTFRRQLNILNDDIGTLISTSTTHVERARQKKKRPIIETRVMQRLSFWQDVLVSKWQRAFSQLSADGRFASLGLVLLAVLSEVCKVTQITEQLEDLAEAEMQQVLLDFGAEEWKDTMDTGGSSAAQDADHAMAEDFGVPMSREALQGSGLVSRAAEKSSSKIRHSRQVKALAMP